MRPAGYAAPGRCGAPDRPGRHDDMARITDVERRASTILTAAIED
ncbi:MAG: hypothetical protein AAF205_13005 [Pseudomonadota bacterium]